MLVAGFKECFALLSSRQKREYWLVVTVVTFSSLMDMVGIASVVPVVTILVDLEGAIEEGYLLVVYQTIGVKEKSQFLIIVVLFALVLVWVSMVIGVLGIYARQRFLKRLSADLSIRVYKKYLSFPIEQFYKKSSGEFLRDVNGVSERIATGIIDASIVIISRGVQIIAISAVLMLANVKVTLLIVCVISASYLIIYFGVKRRLMRISSENFEGNKRVQQVLLASYHNYRNLHIDNGLDEFGRKFSRVKNATSKKSAEIEFLGSVPKEFIEVVGLSLLLAASYLLGNSSVDGSEFISIMTLIGIAAYRVLPSAQQFYHSVNRMLSALEVFSKVKYEWGGLEEESMDDIDRFIDLEFNNIFIDNVKYSYAGASVFKGLTLNIPLEGIVHLSGMSGAGKSTLLEIIAGLRVPDEGRVLVDGVPIGDLGVRNFWANISYVSQDGYIFNGSVMENILGGEKALDMARVKQVAAICGLNDFLAQRPGGFNYVLDEGGKNISGGQRARISLARALYKKSRLLLFDESFSALDVTSARRILKEIRREFPGRRILIISHRVQEVSYIDNVVSL